MRQTRTKVTEAIKKNLKNDDYIKAKSDTLKKILVIIILKAGVRILVSNCCVLPILKIFSAPKILLNIYKQ